MKKLYSIAFTALALFAIGTACSKEEKKVAEENGNKPAAEVITISATLSDLSTKVAYTETDGAGLTLTWQEGDKLLVVNHADPTNDPQEFDLIAEYVGKQTGHFTGTLPAGATLYDVSVVHATTDYSVQTQPKDGDLSALELIAYAEEVDNIKEFSLTDHSSILKIEAKLPEGVAGTITSVQITAIDNTDATGATPSNIFFGGNTLTINLGEKADVDSDNILKLYATIPDKDSDPSNTAFIIKFISDSEHSEYTRFVVLKDGATLDPMAVHTLKINCSKSDLHAGKADADGTQEKPYLIADKYQLMAVDGLMKEDETIYFMLIDNIDMTGETWTHLNGGTGYKKLVNFNGNYRTISNLDKHLFYVFKGSVYNLTLENSIITSRGILAEYIQGTGHVITNVTVKNGKITSSSANVGGLIGTINNGTENVTSVTITDCLVSGTDVNGGSVVGGLIGFANALFTMNGCTYSGGTVSTAGRYLGGAIGSTADATSIISDCHVENATITSTNKDDARCGGFIGQSQTSVQIKGCTVGTELEKVIVNTATPNDETVLNSGGFVGVNYGTITKNGSERNKAYVQVKSTNNKGQHINLGGFVGFHRGTIEYSDAIVDMSDLQGQYIGGFSGYMMNADSKADNCTLLGSVRGNNYTGGFVGVADIAAITNCQVLEGTVVVGQSTAGGFAAQIKAGTVENCSANTTMQSRGGNCGGFVGALTGGTVQRCSSAGTLSQIESTNTVFGGFAGYVNGADLTKCSSTVNITVARSYVGGLVGDFQTANTVSECFYNGTISGPSNTKGGLIGRTSAAAVVITNCYTAGELIASSGTQIYGGIVGELLAGGSVTNCYSTMDMTHGGRAMGGIVGRACSGGWPVSNASNNTISKCIAWNPNITFDGNASTSASSGAIVGYTSFKNILNNCYRRYDMVYKNSNTAVGTSCQTSMVDQVDCDGTNWAINGNRPAGGTPAGTSASAQYQAPYYGVAAASNATVSSIAQTLGWSSDVWNFEGPLPILK